MSAAASVYQLHPGGWLRRADAADPPLSRQALDAALADTLVPYALNLGFTQIELLSNPPLASADAPSSATASTPPPASASAFAPAPAPASASASASASAPAPTPTPVPASLPRLAERCRSAGLQLLPPGSSALLVAASEDGMGFDDPWRTGLAAEWRRHLPKVPAATPQAAPDRLQRFALLRARLALMWAQPGAKRVAMGSEFAQQRPWTLDGGLDWHLLADPLHEGVQRLVHDLNHLRGDCTALQEPADAGPDAGVPSAPQAGFFWTERDNVDGGVLAFLRVAVGASQHDAAVDATAEVVAAPALLIAANLSPTEQPSYRFGVPRAGRWVERLFTGSTHYGGSGDGWPNGGVAVTEPVSWSGHAQSLVLSLPAQSTLFLERRP